MRRDATEALGSVIFALIATDTARVSVRPSVSLAVCPISRRSRVCCYAVGPDGGRCRSTAAGVGRRDVHGLGPSTGCVGLSSVTFIADVRG